MRCNVCEYILYIFFVCEAAVLDVLLIPTEFEVESEVELELQPGAVIDSTCL